MTTDRRLDLYRNTEFTPGRGKVIQIAWYFVSLIIFENGWCPLSAVKRFLLRLFGAKIGVNVVIKPNVRIKFPWRLSIGNFTWIGQEVWIDNLDNVTIGNHSVLSQGAYLCTGSHNHRSPTFELRTAPISIGDGAWICAKAILLPGTVVADNQVISAGKVFSSKSNHE
jgi:putative colanic acid biosynthesis acetyltransferase WcaF